jgi:1-deoxy-D-xylulose-5-phosphate reductoisomerase
VVAVRQVTVLGSTGSIGVSTLDVLGRHPDRFELFAVAANRSTDALFEQCQAHRPRFAAMADPDCAEQLAGRLAEAGSSTEVLGGEAALLELAAHPDVDLVMAAIVGATGLEPTLAAARAGKQVLLANKEALVMAGHLFMAAVAEHGASLLPIDSEHNAIFQCLPAAAGDAGQSGAVATAGVSKILLTASGGPFREWSLQQMAAATPEQACAHPNWSMGRKISVDSASLMNKGLELVEACWLFDVGTDQVEVVVHPQSIIHSMVQYVDGSVLAQLGNPDMRTPIAHALGWPERIGSGVSELDIIEIGRLDFERPDDERFPCLRLARQSVQRGGTAMALLNAANEEAVAAFLDRRLGFTEIPELIETVLARAKVAEPISLDVVKQADLQARELAREILADR